MAKRKILMLAMSICMVAILAVGGTLAYFTDEDQATNVFTVGNIDIELDETFDPEDGEDILPGEKVEKIVNVNNIGSNPAYVRVHIAFPAILDSGSEDQPEYAAYNNTLHWNFTSASLADGEWNWNADETGANYPGNGGNWNCYTDTIDGVTYNIYVATYETALVALTGETATPAITQVYLDTALTQEQWAEIKDVFGEDEEVKVLVWAEGVQQETFDSAYVALNTAFGDPQAAGYVSPWNQ